MLRPGERLPAQLCGGGWGLQDFTMMGASAPHNAHSDSGSQSLSASRLLRSRSCRRLGLATAVRRLV